MKILYFTTTLVLFCSTLSLAQPGSLDFSFGGNGIVTTSINNTMANDVVRSIAVQPDGKIIAAGYAGAGINYHFAVVRYNPDGTLDITFDTDGKVTTYIGEDDFALSVAVQPDGKILAGGYVRTGYGDYYFSLVRYNENGSLDTTFGSNGIVITEIDTTYYDDYGYSVALQPDGKILVAGRTAYNLALVRYQVDGTLDNTFGVNGIVIDTTYTESEGWSLIVQPDGKILVAGKPGISLSRYNPDGAPDNTFGLNGKTGATLSYNYNVWGWSMALQSDGKILAAGHSNFDFAIARFLADGSPDSSFDTDGVVTTDIGTSSDEWGGFVAVQPDGKILLAGQTELDWALLRYNADGSLDNTFDYDGKVITDIGNDDNDAWAIALQPDGKILVAGDAYISIEQDFALARYNSGMVVGPDAGSVSETFIRVFPNPGNGIFTVSCMENTVKILRVNNLLGEKIFETELPETKKDLHLENFPGGIYFLQIYSEKKERITVRKIVINK